MKRRKKHTVVTVDTEFHGFLDGMDIVEAGKTASLLRRKEIPTFIHIDGNNSPTEKELVEELLNRNPVFMTGAEAKLTAPFSIIYPHLHFCQYDRKNDELKPKNPDWGDREWVELSTVQYKYGKPRCFRRGCVFLWLFSQ